MLVCKRSSLVSLSGGCNLKCIYKCLDRQAVLIEFLYILCRSLNVIVALILKLRNPTTTNITCYCVWYQHQHQPRCHRQYSIQNMALSGTPLRTPAQAHSVICNLLISTCTLISTLQDLVAALDIVPYAKESLNHKMSWCSKRCRMSCHDIMPLCHFGLFHLQVHERLCRSDGLWTIKNHPGQTLQTLT